MNRWAQSLLRFGTAAALFFALLLPTAIAALTLPAAPESCAKACCRRTAAGHSAACCKRTSNRPGWYAASPCAESCRTPVAPFRHLPAADLAVAAHPVGPPPAPRVLTAPARPRPAPRPAVPALFSRPPPAQA